MTDALRPGEIDLDAPAGDPPVADPPAADPPVSDPPAADPPAADPPAGDPAAGGDRRPPTGMLAELIEERRARKEEREARQTLERHVQQLQPVLQRLTPEVQQAIMDGRVQIAPPEASRAAEQARLADVAETLQLYKIDGTGNTVPDLDAAARVSKFVRSEVQAGVAPAIHMSLAEKANANVAKAIAYAQEHGLDVDIVRDEFMSIAAQANGAELLSQGKIAKQVWRGAIGRMHEEGKLTAKEAKKAAAAAPPAAIITEARGSRGAAGAGVVLSPALQRVYQEHGVNPAKSFTASRPTLDYNGPIDLE